MRFSFSALMIFMITVVGIIGLPGISEINAQTIYNSDSSEVRFSSQTPIEAVSAVNHASTGFVEMSTRTVRIQVPVAAFQFENSLMQEHFNEGYLDPKKFPYATFNGKLADSLDLSVDTIYSAQVTGVFNLHGVDRIHTFKGTITCKDSIAQLNSAFVIVLADHNVKIPGAVFHNIAKEVGVTVYFRLRPYRKKE